MWKCDNVMNVMNVVNVVNVRKVMNVVNLINVGNVINVGMAKSKECHFHISSFPNFHICIFSFLVRQSNWP